MRLIEIIIAILVNLQKFVYNKKLWTALIHMILYEEPVSKYREFFMIALKNLRTVDNDWLSMSGEEFEKGSITEKLERIVPLLDQRFEVVWEVWELKWEFYMPPMDEARWKKVLADRKEKWIQAWWSDAETIIPAIWDSIHHIALEIEKKKLEQAQLQHWIDENGLLSTPYYKTPVLETGETNRKPKQYKAIMGAMEETRNWIGNIVNRPRTASSIVSEKFFH